MARAVAAAQVKRLPECKHELVETGKVCPACCWNIACKQYLSSKQRKELVAIFVEACRRQIPVDRNLDFERELMRGNWYALQFVTANRGSFVPLLLHKLPE